MKKKTADQQQVTSIANRASNIAVVFGLAYFTGIVSPTWANNHLKDANVRSQVTKHSRAEHTNTQAVQTQEYQGIKYGVNSDPYWLSLGGSLKLDQRIFLGQKYTLHNGALIRDFSLEFSGGMGKDVSVALGLSFNPKASLVSVEDAYITYTGFKKFGDNFQISIGKVNPSFCLETHTSGKWIPFMERSSVTTAFRPDPGLGVSINKWQKHYSISGSITQPKPNNKLLDAAGDELTTSDRLQANVRATRAHFFSAKQLVQLGIFGHFKDDNGAGIEFSSPIEAITRYATFMPLNTTSSSPTKLIQAKNHYAVGLEMLAQNGPFSGEIEYQLARVQRDPLQSTSNLRFKGYRSNINYVLTGEARKFKNSSGTLGQVIPVGKHGAREISGRYDYLNLNNQDIQGGSAHHAGIATTWYIDHNFAVTGEYVRTRVHTNQGENLTINAIGARIQLVF